MSQSKDICVGLQVFEETITSLKALWDACNDSQSLEAQGSLRAWDPVVGELECSRVLRKHMLRLLSAAPFNYQHQWNTTARPHIKYTEVDDKITRFTNELQVQITTAQRDFEDFMRLEASAATTIDDIAQSAKKFKTSMDDLVSTIEYLWDVSDLKNENLHRSLHGKTSLHPGWQSLMVTPRRVVFISQAEPGDHMLRLGDTLPEEW